MAFVLSNGEPALTAAHSPAPRPLQAICAKAMAQEPSARYQSVGELAADIASFLEQSPVNAYRESIVDRLQRLTQRHGTAIVLVAAYLLMRILFIIFARH